MTVPPRCIWLAPSVGHYRGLPGKNEDDSHRYRNAPFHSYLPNSHEPYREACTPNLSADRNRVQPIFQAVPAMADHERPAQNKRQIPGNQDRGDENSALSPLGAKTSPET